MLARRFFQAALRVSGSAPNCAATADAIRLEAENGRATFAETTLLCISKAEVTAQRLKSKRPLAKGRPRQRLRFGDPTLWSGAHEVK